MKQHIHRPRKACRFCLANGTANYRQARQKRIDRRTNTRPAQRDDAARDEYQQHGENGQPSRLQESRRTNQCPRQQRQRHPGPVKLLGNARYNEDHQHTDHDQCRNRQRQRIDQRRLQLAVQRLGLLKINRQPFQHARQTTR